MLIRSQDKKQLLNLDNGHISIDFRNRGRVLFCGLSFSNQEDYTCIGEYSTEEKAINVLDMIQKQYARFSCRYGADHSEDAVFQMPQDGYLCWRCVPKGAVKDE